MLRHGETVAQPEPFELEVAEHVTKGDFIGQGSPYVVFQGDLEPLDADEAERYVRRFEWLAGELADWAGAQPAESLDTKPETGRTARQILLHVLGSAASYLGPSIGAPSGASSLATAAERGQLPIEVAIPRLAELIAARVRDATPEERALVRENPKGARNLRKSVRRLLEHTWEHLAELSRRPGGPEL